MERLYTNIVTKNDALTEIETVLKDRYGLSNNNLDASLHILQDYLDKLEDGIFVLVEHPYVDKTYRDTYYNYFASKRDDYPRNTIRLSFLRQNMDENAFRSANKLTEIQKNYLGFVVLRPTFPFIIGRSLLHPDVVKEKDFKICAVNYNSTINGVKVTVSGFPHSAQDGETITCAETTVWSLMEYFGNKYAEYAPVLPSEVNKILGRFAFERLVPSKGLTAAQISYALREIGYGVKIYSKNVYGDDYFRLLRTYVESGIPVVGLLTNNNGIGHALNIIGRRKIKGTDIGALPVLKALPNNVNVFDFADLDLDYVYIDDNHAPYRTCPLSNPAAYYTDARWVGCEVSNFIVPLYPKIYLEAGEARTIAISTIEQLGLINNKDVLIKSFLTSSRSFKNSIALNNTLQEDAKELLLNTPMPKFIWVTEISDKTLILDDKANGMIVMDATEPKRYGIIAALIEDNYISNDLTNFTKVQLPLQSFLNYQNNLT